MSRPTITTTPGGPPPGPADHDNGLDVVTGAFSYSGRAIARELAAAGRAVRTLTGHPQRAPQGAAVDVRPLDFDDPTGLVDSLRGATTLYNTYWIRFPRGQRDHDRAVANSRTLFSAARRAGVARVVHVSITHPSIESPYSYFRGKSLAERALTESGLSYGIVRPTILFGGDDVLLNNIAWLLRRLPVFAIGGRGDYRLRPIHVDDLARLCVQAGADRNDTVLDAAGPERLTFRDLVWKIREAIGSRARLLRVPGPIIPALAYTLGLALRDVVLTPEEYRAMADGLADTNRSTGTTHLSQWLSDHGAALGLHYANELDRHFR